MKFVKKQGAGTWLTLCVLLLTIATFIVYGVNIGSSGYFKGGAIPAVVTYSVIALVVEVAVLVLAQIKVGGILGVVMEYVTGALKILIGVFLILALLELIDGRIEGLAYIYFSNEDVLATIQTPENLASGSTAIANMVMYGVTAVVACVAAFFRPYKVVALKTAKQTA